MAQKHVYATGRSFEVRKMDDVIWGKYAPTTRQKGGVNRQFQAKTPKFLHRNISGTINPTKKRFKDRVQTTKGISWVVRYYSIANKTWLTAAILKIDMTSNFRSRWSYFDKIRQSDAEKDADYGEMVEIVTGIEFQYGGRLFFQTGSRYTSAVNWATSTKFGLQIDFHLLKKATSTNRNIFLLFCMCHFAMGLEHCYKATFFNIYIDWTVRISDIPVFKIILVLVRIKFNINHLSISFYIVFIIILVPVSI